VMSSKSGAVIFQEQLQGMTSSSGGMVREPRGERVQHGHHRVHVCAPSTTWCWRDWTVTVSETLVWHSCAYTCSIGRGREREHGATDGGNADTNPVIGAATRRYPH
jgi:hypothetical protein